jgi:hypothetical protein
MDSLKKIRTDAVGRELKSTMATQLHSAYDEVLKEELPPRLCELLRRLDQSFEHRFR